MVAPVVYVSMKCSSLQTVGSRTASQVEVHSPGRGETDAKGSLYLGGLVPCDCEVEKDPAISRGKNIVYMKNNSGVIFFLLFSFLDLI